MGNRLDKQNIIDQIQTYVTPKNQHYLQYILDLLTKTIDVKYWTPTSSTGPGNYTFAYSLNSDGYPYFILDRRAIIKLREFDWPLDLQPTIRSIIQSIVSLDQEQASIAISNAISGSGATGDIGEAQDEYSQGVTCVDKQVYGQAVKHFGLAFRFAQQSLQGPTGLCVSHLPHLSLLSLPSGSTDLTYVGADPLFIANLLVGGRSKSNTVLLANPSQILTLSPSDYAAVPFITTQPISFLSAPGPISVTTESTVSSVSYQWYNGNVAISGANASTYDVTTNGTYVCVVSAVVNGITINAISESTVY